MALTNYTTVDTATNALANAAARQGITPGAKISAEQLAISAVANMLNGQVGGAEQKVGPGAGALGTGGFVETSVTTDGGIIVTRILIDLTGLASSTTDLDIIGQGSSAAYLCQITAAENGTIIGGSMTCLEAPVGGVTDIDLYKATVDTGVFDGAVTSLTGQAAVVTSGAAWTLGRVVGTAADGIATGDYLYLAGGALGTAASYTAGRILITLFGRNA